MAYKFNPFTNKLDYHTHAGILSYKFIGWTAESPPVTDPGVGNFSLNDTGISYELVINTTDKRGRDLGYTLLMLLALGFTAVYDVWFWLHSKRDPSLYYGLWATVEDMDSIDDGEGNVLAWIVPIVPVLVSMTYDAETDVYTSYEIPDNDEVLLSMDFTFNPDYIGTLGTQDSNTIAVTGGSISGTNLYDTNSYQVGTDTPTAEPGWATSSTVNMNAPDGYLKFKVGAQDVVVPYWNT